MRSLLLRVLVMLAALTLSLAAAAATVETKVRLLVRDRPSSSSRIIDRVAAGKKLPVLGRSPDGSWIHVRSGGHDGWVPAESVKGGRAAEESSGDESASDEEDARPLAKKRGVRPEAWVSKSRYHEGEETKLIISVNKAELYGRPANTGAVLGILRRGEAVQMVTRSPDKKWINVDIGGGSTAWIEAKAVKPGKVQTETPPPDESAQEEAAPPPTITPEGAKRKAKLAKVETPPPPEEEAAPPPPPPPVKKKKTKAAPPPEATVETPPEAPAGKNSEDETPPGLDTKKTARSDEPPPPEENRKKKKSRKLTKLASRNSDASGSSAAEGSVVRDRWTSRGKLYVTPNVHAGIAIIEQRFTSNGMGPLSNYQASTGALGLQIGIGMWGTVGKYLLFGGDGSYTFVGAAALRYIQPTDGTTVVLGVQSHSADAGVSAGLHFGALGGLTVRVRLGGQLVLNLVQPDVRTKLPSDRILGMTIGLGVAAPALFTLANRPFGVALFGGGLVPAARAQTLGLEDGAQSTTFGAFFGGALSYALMAPNLEHYKGQLSLEAGYTYEFVATHYTGLSRRNNSISIADRGSAQHLIALGLNFYY